MLLLTWQKDAPLLWDASIRSVYTDGESAISIEPCYFHPQGGGQPGDKGIISFVLEGTTHELRIIDTLLHKPGGGDDAIDEKGGTGTKPGVRMSLEQSEGNAEVLRRLKNEENVRVHCVVDGEWRAAISRAHTAQHLVSAALFQNKGIATLKAEIRGDKAKMVLDKALDESEIWDAIAAAREQIAANMEVESILMPQEEYERKHSGLRGKKSKSQTVRLVHVQGFDTVACGGTHVKMLAQIGEITRQSYSDNKLAIVTGRIATDLGRQRERTASGIACQLAVGDEQLLSCVRNLKTRAELLSILLTGCMRGMTEIVTDYGEPMEQVKIITLQFEELSPKQVRAALSKSMKSAPPKLLVVCYDADTIILFGGRSLKVDMFSEQIRGEFPSARGGGKGGFAQFTLKGEGKAMQEVARKTTSTRP